MRKMRLTWTSILMETMKLMSSEKDSNNHCKMQNKNESDLLENQDLNDLPF